MLTGHFRWYSLFSFWGRHLLICLCSLICTSWNHSGVQSIGKDIYILKKIFFPLEIKEVVCWGRLLSDCKILNFQQSTWNHEVNHHARSLKLAIMRIFTPWRIASSTNQGFPLPERWSLNTPGQAVHLPHGLEFTVVFGGRWWQHVGFGLLSVMPCWEVVIFACGFSVLLFLYVHHRGWARLEGDHPRAPFLLSLDHMAASTVPRTNRSCTGTVGTVSCSEGWRNRYHLLEFHNFPECRQQRALQDW